MEVTTKVIFALDHMATEPAHPIHLLLSPLLPLQPDLATAKRALAFIARLTSPLGEVDG
jgi:hypothetical protein